MTVCSADKSKNNTVAEWDQSTWCVLNIKCGKWSSWDVAIFSSRRVIIILIVIIVRRKWERLLRRSFISHGAAGLDCTHNRLFPVITASSNSSPTRPWFDFVPLWSWHQNLHLHFPLKSWMTSHVAENVIGNKTSRFFISKNRMHTFVSYELPQMHDKALT